MVKVYWYGQGLAKNTARAFFQRKPYDGDVDSNIERPPAISMKFQPSLKSCVFNDATC